MQVAPVEQLAGAVLHAGCGENPLPQELEQFGGEVRLDIDRACNPDIAASITDMGDIGPFKMVYCSHCIEHLAPHEVKTALLEMRRVLAPDGFALIIVPNLEGIRPTDDVVYVSPYGPITGRDMIYGHADLIAATPYMAHRSGFVSETLRATMEDAGFASVHVFQDDGHNLIALGAMR